MASAYRPSLTVDVSADVKDDGPISSVAQTPHVSTNIFVAGVPSTWDDNALREHFQPYGEIMSTKVVKNRHFGFVMFRRPECAHAAINETHLTKPSPNSSTLLHVSIAMHDEGVDDEPNDRIFVRGLPQWATEEHMRHLFGRFGNIVECAVLMNQQNQCKGSGFVRFEKIEEATAAVEGQDSVRIENWDAPLEVKYCESPEVRQQRQERNRRRQKNWTNLPKYKGGSGPMPATSPYQYYQPPMSVVPQQGFPLLSPVPFPIVFPQPSPVHSVAATSPHPTQIIYPQPVQHNYYQIMVDAPPFPQKGDLHFLGIQSEELLRLLVEPFGEIAEIKQVDENSMAVRMKDSLQHGNMARQLTGTTFSTGQMLSVGLYA